MDINLLVDDMNDFLKKYTRFMTKNIYISNTLATRFLSNYQYLYEILEKNKFLFHNNFKYKQIMNIRKNHSNLLKFHNQKYLIRKGVEDKEFFDNLSFGKKLDIRKRHLILCEEDNLLVIEAKNEDDLVRGKISYLVERQEYQPNQIFILTEQKEDSEELSQIFFKEDVKVFIQNLKDYGFLLKKEEEVLLESSAKYDILVSYLTEKLFSRKESFRKFYQAFSKYIYLNKDYQEYETFKDYHNYMYKRKFLSSHLSLKKFNEREVGKRRTYLRTILNESVRTKEEVDIANFLYLNSISYHYDFDSSTFQIWLDEKQNQVCYLKEKEPLEVKNTSIGATIYLYESYVEKKTTLEVLAYELIKRRYPLEYITDEILYQKLKETTMESYFSEFLSKYFIPILDEYEENHTLKNTKLNEEQREVFLSLYSDYQTYIKEHHFLKEEELLLRISQDIQEKKYRYLILLGNIPICCNIPTLTIIPDYPEVELLKENIKLLYDYKQYLYQNQSLPIAHTYQNREELQQLTSSFIKENLKLINQELDQTKKKIDIYLYDDGNRLHIYSNISKTCSEILKRESSSILIALSNLKDMNLLIAKDSFSKLNKNTLVTNEKRSVLCEEFLNITKHLDTILIPNLIVDSFHEDILRTNEYYHIKVMIYVVLNKCRQKTILLCPKSRQGELRKILGSLNFQIIN